MGKYPSAGAESLVLTGCTPFRTLLCCLRLWLRDFCLGVRPFCSYAARATHSDLCPGRASARIDSLRSSILIMGCPCTCGTGTHGATPPTKKYVAGATHPLGRMPLSGSPVLNSCARAHSSPETAARRMPHRSLHSLAHPLPCPMLDYLRRFPLVAYKNRHGSC